MGTSAAWIADITGIPVTQAGVLLTFNTVKQQLPPVPTIDAFLASHQTGIAQLAIKYCAALVDDTTARTAFFGPALSLGTPAATLFADQNGKNIVINPLIDKVIGTGLASQPTAGDVRTELTALMTKLMSRVPATDTATITKAACAAALGSGALTVQ